MTIISLQKQFKQFFNANILQKMAKSTGLIKRCRAILPDQLVISLVAALSKGNCTSIADLLRQFNCMCLSPEDAVAYKPYHNQLRKDEFPKFMRQLVIRAIAQFARPQNAALPDKLDIFDDVLLQDGSSFHIHRDLADVYPSRFKRNPAAVECHMTMSLKTFSPVAMSISADTASERDFLPEPQMMKNKLLLADAGYPDFHFFRELEQYGGFYIVRGAKSLNPMIIEARNGQGRLLPKLEGKKLKEITRGTNRSQVLDLKVRRGKQEFRVMRRWFAEEKRFCIWITNLPSDTYTADDIMAIYRCRWQVELLFKELKSHTNWQRFATAQKAIVDGLIWASLLALIIRRSTALQILPSVSLFKAAENVDVWLLPIFECISHRAWPEINNKIEWAVSYISRNAQKSVQRKSKENIILDGIYSGLNS
ncbi:IS4 family transposase [Vibrio vulnificus]|uniref:IS4 family transposase n=1 Tax=Vibrio vulnificus TaxID=672 RepID=UPI0024E01643|nr:IS4 family transposase [Vibrio vulnificus]MDK2600797.1 IS4 family transposase [Vibrio vulnificus]MDK2623941.1 IS4 family transposase [Vibrio vulnificus]MDK2641016.1 IS4 family transposase [Vibrio vulnificus]MDK2667326.1 IS4 family transposase [Vibrio vulnificus]MDK2676708.1 IS4 family transposase [Vibrio vulnificus]